MTDLQVTQFSSGIRVSLGAAQADLQLQVTQEAVAALLAAAKEHAGYQAHGDRYEFRLRSLNGQTVLELKERNWASKLKNLFTGTRRSRERQTAQDAIRQVYTLPSPPLERNARVTGGDARAFVASAAATPAVQDAVSFLVNSREALQEAVGHMQSGNPQAVVPALIRWQDLLEQQVRRTLEQAGVDLTRAGAEDTVPVRTRWIATLAASLSVDQARAVAAALGGPVTQQTQIEARWVESSLVQLQINTFLTDWFPQQGEGELDSEAYCVATSALHSQYQKLAINIPTFVNDLRDRLADPEAIDSPLEDVAQWMGEHPDESDAIREGLQQLDLALLKDWSSWRDHPQFSGLEPNKQAFLNFVRGGYEALQARPDLSTAQKATIANRLLYVPDNLAWTPQDLANYRATVFAQVAAGA